MIKNMRELAPSSEECHYVGSCKGDGLCDVYEQVFTDNEEDEEADEHGFKGYARLRNTEWCSCTLQMSMGQCPNSVLCGNTEVPKWLLACHNMLCTGCNVTVGRNLEFLSSDNLPAEWECTICMEQKDKACVFPDCPAKHSFCLDCMKKLLWGVPNPRYNPDESDNDEEPYECATEACPTCRHQFDPSKGWRARMQNELYAL
jgi:hypothetical protein